MTNVALTLSLEDQATATWNQFEQEIRAGSERIAQHGKETSKLTQFIREQRLEQRQQSFLFRETKDLLGTLTFSFIALSSVTGKQDEATKKLDQTLVTAYAGFQAADFAIAGLGLASGGTALAIAGLVGGGVGLMKFLQDTVDHAKLAQDSVKQLEGTLIGLSEQQKATLLQEARAGLEKSKKELESLKTNLPIPKEVFKEMPGALKGLIAFNAGMDAITLKSRELTKEERERIRILEEIEIPRGEERVKQLDGSITKEEQLRLEGAKRIQGVLDEIALLKEKNPFLKQILQAEQERDKALRENLNLSQQEKNLINEKFEILKKQIEEAAHSDKFVFLLNLKLKWSKEETDRAVSAALQDIEKAFGTNRTEEVLFNPNVAGLVDLRERRIEDINYLIKNTQNQEFINKLLKERKKLERELSIILKEQVQLWDVFIENMTEDEKKQWEWAMKGIEEITGKTTDTIYNLFQGSVQGISGLIDGFADSTIKTFERMMADLAAKGILSFLLSIAFPGTGFGGEGGFFNLLTGGLGKALGLVGGGPSKSVGGASLPSSPIGAKPAQIVQHIYIQANDAKSFQQMLSQPEHRRALGSVIAQEARLGRM